MSWASNENVFTLHSTMFLLIPQQQFANWDCNASLHSTMFLLIRRSLQLQSHRFPVFTFHNVSINTHRNQSEGKFEHFFTFHNVSINTIFSLTSIATTSIFTFHNVSINTEVPHPSALYLVFFTFHNVSINTIAERQLTDRKSVV